MIAKEEIGTSPALPAFGHLLKRLRTAADLTQEKLAERACVSPRLISDLERGAPHRPRRDTVQMLADGLGLTGQDRDTFVTIGRGRLGAVTATLSPDEGPKRHAIPLPPTPIVDRLKEIAAISSLLMEPVVRLLTLTGPGGVGKTRLAIEAASRTQSAFTDGAILVELAPLRDPTLVLPTIAQAVGGNGEDGLPPIEALTRALQSARVLLVLDNFEHLTAAAADVGALVSACEALTVLTTSRTPLHLRAEREYRVEPLAVPDLDDPSDVDALARTPAVELFLRLASSSNRSFAVHPGNVRTVAEITARLDGLPLAIELAAARATVLPPSALLDRLEQRLPLLTGGARDLPARLQTMHAAIDWSHDLLNDQEQRLFRRLAVFPGGWTLDAAERVACRESWVVSTDERTPHDSCLATHDSVLDLVSSLVDKSLLRVLDSHDGEPRFGMLATIREYAEGRLAASGEEPATRRRHAAWCLDLAARAEPELSGPRQSEWFCRLDAEHDNLRAALHWAIERREAENSQRLCGALWRFWETRGHFAEARRWLDQALALDGESPPSVRAHAVGAAGVMAARQGNDELASSLFEDGLALYRAAGDLTGTACTLNDLAIVLCALGQYDRAEALHLEALALFRTLGERVHESRVLGNLGMLAYDQRDYARAAALHDESLTLRREIDDPTGIAGSLVGLALVHHAEGRPDQAAVLQQEALTIFHTLGNKLFVAEGFENLAVFAASSHEPLRAARLFGTARSLRAEIGAPPAAYRRAFCERGMAEAQNQVGEEAFRAAMDEGSALPLDEAAAYALDDGPLSPVGDARVAHFGL